MNQAILHPMHLIGTDALLAGCHQMRSPKPKMQFDIADLENGANRNREFAFAWPAAPQSRATTLTGVIRSRAPQRGTKHLAP
jgi:hypothetical protein